MMVPTLLDMHGLQAELERVEARAVMINPHAFVVINCWKRTPHWSATAHYLDLRAVGNDPHEALHALSLMIERRLGADAALARTLGIEDAA